VVGIIRGFVVGLFVKISIDYEQYNRVYETFILYTTDCICLAIDKWKKCFKFIYRSEYVP
jgi:hypothetical protein